MDALQHENVDKKQQQQSSKASDATKVPLHRRRFDAKHRALPAELISLPNQPERAVVENSRSFCEDLVVRLHKKDETVEELQPLLSRTTNTAMAALATEDAFDHLDKLYRLMDQLITLRDQNSKIQRRIRDIENIKKLQDMHMQIEREMLKTKSVDPDSFFRDDEMSLCDRYEDTEALLDSMLAAGRNASLKRAKWKSPSKPKLRQSIVRSQRSRSMGGEELTGCPLPNADYSSHFLSPYKSTSRRSSDGKQDKSKISKWTRVKAAFKWEKAHTGIVADTPMVPVVRATLPPTGLIVSSSSPTMPAIESVSISSASSAEDVRESGCRHDSARRSRSLDSAVILDPITRQMNHDEDLSSPSIKSHKTPWGKMKNIIQTRKESVRKKQNRNSVLSSTDGRSSECYLSDGGGFSRSESTEMLPNNEVKTPQRKTSSQEKSEINLQELSDAIRRTTPTLTLTMPSSEELTNNAKHDLPPIGNHTPKTVQTPIETKSNQLGRKPKSSDMYKKEIAHSASGPIQDSSDPDTNSPVIQRHDSKWKKVKKAFLTSAPTSTPSSPVRHSKVFTYEPEDIASNNDLVHRSNIYNDEIKRNYSMLQGKTDKEFADKIADWSTSSKSTGTSNSPSAFHGSIDKNKIFNIKGSQFNNSGPSTPGEDKLPVDFKKKYDDWQKSKPMHSYSTSTFTGNANIPSQSQLSEEFRKKLEEWKRLKATNSVPAYTGEDTSLKEHEKDDKLSKMKKTPQKKEVLVQTGAGFFRFEGISRSFTRKLYEWEKSKGIAPEASTSALLRESLAHPPLPANRTSGYGPWHTNYHTDECGLLRLQRSHSVGSVRDDTAPHISTSASSLSLTHLDECNDENQISDIGECFDISPEAENKPICTESDSDGGPGAVLVEIEDEVEETAAPLMACSPRVDPQTPIYRYGQAQERHRACENTDGKISPLPTSCLSRNSSIDQISDLKSNITQLIQDENTIQKLIIGRQNVKDRSKEVMKKIETIKGQSPNMLLKFGDMERRLARLNREEDILLSSLVERIKNFNTSFLKFHSDVKNIKSFLNDTVYENIGNEIFKKVENFNDLNIKRTNAINTKEAYNDILVNHLNNISVDINMLQQEIEKQNIPKKESNLNVSYVITKPKVQTFTARNEAPGSNYGNDACKVYIDSASNENALTQSDYTNKTNDDISSSDETSHTSNKPLPVKLKDNNDKPNQNISKRKSKSRQRIEREKSLPSHSDTEDEINTVTLEFPKRKKPSKARNSTESKASIHKQNSIEKQTNTDSGDNVFVLKLKPNDVSSNNPETDATVSDICTKKNIVMKSNSTEDAPTILEQNKNDSVAILIPQQFSFTLPSHGIELQSADPSKPEVFVKTTRKIFSPVRRDNSGETKEVIGFDLEEIANSIKNRSIENFNKETQLQDNLPDILVNNDTKTNGSTRERKTSDTTYEISSSHNTKSDEYNKRYPISISASLNSIKSQSPSPLFTRKPIHSNSASKILSSSRNESEESLSHSKEVLPIRRGSGERLPPICKGSPVLSRASTPGISGASNSLPPLPASPPLSRRDKPAKETAPSIRIMIQKYNMRLNEEGDKSPSGSNTPPWRSPRLQERFPHDNRRILQQSVRNNPFIDREVQKSASTSQIKNQPNNNNQSKEYSVNGASKTPPLPKKLFHGVLKSSSAGSIKATSHQHDFILNDKIPNFKSTKQENASSNMNENFSKDVLPLSEVSNNEKEENIPTIEQKANNRNYDIYSKKIDINLLNMAKSSPCVPIQLSEVEMQQMEISNRAMKIKQAKEKFLSSETKTNENVMRKDRGTSSNVDLAENRLSQISFNSDASCEANSSKGGTSSSNGKHDKNILTKSASLGMICVERGPFSKLNKRKDKGIKTDKDQSKFGSKFGLSNLASKFRKVKMRGKSKQIEKDEEREKLDTVTRLCRQSLVMNLQDGGAGASQECCIPKRISEPNKSQTDRSILLAGKTGSAVAVNNEEFYAMVNKNMYRSTSLQENPGCNKNV